MKKEVKIICLSAATVLALSSQAWSFSFSDLKKKAEETTQGITGLQEITDLKDKIDEGSSKFQQSMESLYGEASETYEALENALSDPSSQDTYYIGRSVAANILTSYSLYENSALETYLNKVCQALVMNSDGLVPYNGYHVKVLDSDEINAFSTPGGHILITRGMLSCVTSEDTLAAVIAHEISHVQLEHGMQSIKSSRITELGKTTAQKTAQSVGWDGVCDLIDSTSDTIVSKMQSGYSKTQEFEADSKALSLMADAGYNPDAMVTMLEKMDTV